MTFKDILVHMDNSGRASVRLALAVALARSHGAHLVALYVRTDQAAPEARAAFEALTAGDGFTAEWREVEGETADHLALHARYADITIIGQGENGDDEPGLADALVLQVGRPVLVVPSAGSFATVGEQVLVAWNAGREATRAVHDALPLLRRARRTRVVVVNPGGGTSGHGDIPGADIGLHLSRHGVNAVCERISADDIGTGALLLSRAADEGADLIVMGAYGHSRLSELVLGGVTRHILRHMTVPVLLSH
jgi:nucleotide-binding universal stress UspA family protein